MLWPLFLLPIVSSTVFPYPLKVFRRDCQKRDDDGVCDLECRNFFPEAEQLDCEQQHLATHNATLLFEVHDISFKSIVFKEKNRSYYCGEWKKGLEWRLRKYMQVEVELLLSDKEIFDMGVQCFESGGICFVDLTFSVTIADCPSCPKLDDVLGKLSQHQEILSEMALRYIPAEKKSSSKELIFVVIGTVALLAFVVVNVLVTTTRRRKIHSHPIWIPPMEKKEDRFLYSNQLPCYYNQYVDSGRTSLNNSLNGSFSLTKSPYVVDSNTTELHRLSKRDISEEEMIKDANQLLQRGVDINAVTDKGETAVHLAVRRGKCKLVDHLLQCGANGNIPDCSGYSLLHHAVSLEDVSMLKILLKYRNLTTEECDEKGIKPIDEMSRSGKTALMECAFAIRGCRAVEMARMLIAAGADIMVQGEKDYRLNNVDYTGKSVLHYAAQLGNIPLIQLLVDSVHEKSLLLNLLDYHHKTAMYYACEQRQYSTVELLLELGANQYCPPMEPSSFPIEVAKERGYDDIIKLLETYKSRAREAPSKPNKYAVRKSKQRAAEQAQLPSPSSSTSSSPTTSCSQSPPSNSPLVPSTVFDYRTHQNFSYYHPYALLDSQCRYNSKMTNLSPPYFSPPMTDESTTP